MRILTYSFLIALSLPLCVHADAAPERVDLRAHATKALDAMLAARREGGWGTAWTEDGSLVWGEHVPIPDGWITVQPPATPGVALIMLRAATILGEERYLAAARDARDALLALQSKDGGLPHEGKLGAVRKNASFDDHTTTGALEFFIALWQHTGAEEDRRAVDSVGEFILAAQYADSGGWPQNYPPRPGSYHEHITLNDGNMRNIILALLRLHELTGDVRYREAARRGGECILQLQGSAGESVWAQQYDKDTLQPAPARAFEPAGYTAGESVGMCDTLIDLYLAFEDPRYLDAIDRALEWYETHRLPNGKFARIYEPGTQRPIYGRASKPYSTYDVEDARPGYSWQASWYPAAAKTALDMLRAEGAVAFRAKQDIALEQVPIALNNAALTKLCSSLSEGGMWLSHATPKETGELANRKMNPKQKIVHTRVFCTNMNHILDAIASKQPREAGES